MAIIRVKIAEYFRRLSERERRQLLHINNPNYQYIIHDSCDKALALLLDGATTYDNAAIKVFNDVLDYRLLITDEADEYITLLPAHYSYNKDDFSPGIFSADRVRPRLFYTALGYILQEQLFTPPPSGQMYTLAKPIRYLAAILGENCLDEEEIAACVEVLQYHISWVPLDYSDEKLRKLRKLIEQEGEEERKLYLEVRGRPHDSGKSGLNSPAVSEGTGSGSTLNCYFETKEECLARFHAVSDMICNAMRLTGPDL